MKNYASIILVLFACLLTVTAQDLVPDRGVLFNDETISRVDVIMDQDSVDALFARGAESSNHEYPVRFIFDNGLQKDTLEQVGFRLRGNTSRGADKQSFKLSFNTFDSGRKFKGVEKMNLNGEHNDPSLLRAKLGWELFRSVGLPASRSNHVALYLNGNYRGLYINVEHIDEEFVKKRFGNKSGNLYKCLYPADLNYRGPNPTDYTFESNGRRAYDLKTNTATNDYSDLAHFIDVLNNTPNNELVCELEAVFNVDAYLKAAVLDVLISNWDGPIWNKNNFYLYHNTATGQFEYLPYDLDNTFGVDWFSANWEERNIYDWAKSGEPRPLFTRLMGHPVYRKRFTFYMQQILEQQFDKNILFPLINRLVDQLRPFIENDPFYPLDYGWDIEDFEQSITQGLDAFHIGIGLKPYISKRISTALDQLENTNPQPILSQLEQTVDVAAGQIAIRLQVLDDALPRTVQLTYQFDGQGIEKVDMLDDGSQLDGEAGDGIYGYVLSGGLPATGEMVYFVEASDLSAQRSRLPVCSVNTIRLAVEKPALVINELMASNDATIQDEVGEYEDWVELYNRGEEAIYLGDLFLTDDPAQPDRWALPEEELGAGEYLIIWADDDAEQGDKHTNFKLSAKGEFVGIYNSKANNLAVIDSVSFGEQETDVSVGRLPNGVGSITNLPMPSPGGNNETTSVGELEDGVQFAAQPNPFIERTRLQFTFAQPIRALVSIYNSLGKKVWESSVFQKQAKLEMEWDGRTNNGQALPAGIYFVHVIDASATSPDSLGSFKLLLN